MAPQGVKLRLRRSQEVRRSLELQNGGLRALKEAWMRNFSLRHFPVKSGRFLCFSLVVQVAPGGVELRQRRSQEIRGSLELQNGTFRALEEGLSLDGRVLDATGRCQGSNERTSTAETSQGCVFGVPAFAPKTHPREVSGVQVRFYGHEGQSKALRGLIRLWRELALRQKKTYFLRGIKTLFFIGKLKAAARNHMKK